jgi:hypothetical protein
MKECVGEWRFYVYVGNWTDILLPDSDITNTQQDTQAALGVKRLLII